MGYILGKVPGEGIASSKVDIRHRKDAVNRARRPSKAELVLQETVDADVPTNAVRKEKEVVSLSHDVEEPNPRCPSRSKE